MSSETEAARALSSSPVVDPSLAGGIVEDDEAGRRRGLGLAVFVIILVLIATITLSLLLRRPPQSGEGLSRGRTPAAKTVVAEIAPHAGAGREASSALSMNLG